MFKKIMSWFKGESEEQKSANEWRTKAFGDKSYHGPYVFDHDKIYVAVPSGNQEDYPYPFYNEQLVKRFHETFPDLRKDGERIHAYQYTDEDGALRYYYPWEVNVVTLSEIGGFILLLSYGVTHVFMFGYHYPMEEYSKACHCFCVMNDVEIHKEDGSTTHYHEWHREISLSKNWFFWAQNIHTGDTSHRLVNNTNSDYALEFNERKDYQGNIVKNIFRLGYNLSLSSQKMANYYTMEGRRKDTPDGECRELLFLEEKFRDNPVITINGITVRYKIPNEWKIKRSQLNKEES